MSTPIVDAEFTPEPMSAAEMVVLAELLLGLRKPGGSDGQNSTAVRGSK